MYTNSLNSLAEALNQKFDIIIAPIRHLYSLLLDRSLRSKQQTMHSDTQQLLSSCAHNHIRTVLIISHKRVHLTLHALSWDVTSNLPTHVLPVHTEI